MPRKNYVPAFENWPCFVGSGECKTPATQLIDDGEGGWVYICEAHAIEFDRMEKMLENRPDLCERLSKAIDEHE